MVAGSGGAVLLRLSGASGNALAPPRGAIAVGGDRHRFIRLEHKYGARPSFIYILSAADAVLGVHRRSAPGKDSDRWPQREYASAVWIVGSAGPELHRMHGFTADPHQRRRRPK